VPAGGGGPHPQQARGVVGVVVIALEAPLAAAVRKACVTVVVAVAVGATPARPGICLTPPVRRRGGAGAGAAAGVRVGV